MARFDWHEFDLDALSRELRATLPAAEAERMVWAFERALGVARIDGELLGYLLAAAASLMATAEGSTPRAVLEANFRRSVSDQEWRERYAWLFG